MTLSRPHTRPGPRAATSCGRGHDPRTPRGGPRRPLPPRARAGQGRHGHRVPGGGPAPPPQGGGGRCLSPEPLPLSSAPSASWQNPHHRQPAAPAHPPAPRLGAGGGDGLLRDALRGRRDLRDRLTAARSSCPIEDAVRIASLVAAAPDYAHRQGVIHRDIKPENIPLHDGSALVADFGMASLAASSTGGGRMTETGMSLGTPHYMSPEQAMGEREITARSDVYALGVMTYEMLTGDPPFTGSTAQAIVARVMTEDARPITLRSGRPSCRHVEAAGAHRAREAASPTAFARRRRSSPSGAGAAGRHDALPALGAGGRAAARRLAPALLPWVLCVAAGAAAVWGWSRRATGAVEEGAVVASTIVRPDLGAAGLTWAWLRSASAARRSRSPDGGVLAYVAQRGGDGTQLFLRPMDRGDTVIALPGTEGRAARSSRRTGPGSAYQARDQLSKVRVGASAARRIPIGERQ
ncbi:MAG: serine/threonine protein kinase, partial [Gemmatimonadetes bacterium]|nr:serine/threonine protein kinase [Gemmatimonadota bacterium]